MNFFSILTERETKSNTIKIYPKIEKYKLTYIICTYMSEMKEHRNLPFGTLGRPLVL